MAKRSIPEKRQFDSVLRWLLLTTVLWSFTALATTGELPVLIAIGGYPMILLAWYGETRYPLNKWIWRGLIVIAALYVGWYFQTQARTDAIIYLLLFLLINKLWSPKKPRDIMQIEVICFFFMLSASILTMNMSFIFFFIGFVFLMIVGLALLTVRREHEMLGSLGADSRAGVNPNVIVPNDFFWRSLGSMLVIFFFTFWIFALFPRFAEQRMIPGTAALSAAGQTGFTNDIRLGNVDQIDMDSTTVMRVMMPLPPAVQNLYLRGAVLEDYENGKWTPNPEVHQTEPRYRSTSNDSITLLSNKPQGPVQEVKYAVFLNPTANGNLFMLENTTQLQLSRRGYGVEYDPQSNTSRIPFPQARVINYSATSFVRTADAHAMEELEKAAAVKRAAHSSITASDWTSEAIRIVRAMHKPQTTSSVHRETDATGQDLPDRRIYLGIPTTPAKARVARIAQVAIASAKATTDLQKARAIENYLQQNYRYSLKNLSMKRKEPTETFLTETRQGHCEYFASAMALLLRHAGIPSRIVNGFYTDRWNPVGDYFQVEKADAHSWVEAFIDGLGWVSFDPSPPGEIVRQGSARGLFYKLRSYSDAIKMKWRLYVIDYDLRDQSQFVRTMMQNTPDNLGPIGRLLANGAQFFSGNLNAREAAGKAVFALSSAIGLVLLAFGSVFALKFLRRRRRSREYQLLLQRRRVALYEKILKTLARRGFIREPGITPMEFARRVEQARPDLDGFVELTRLYYELRYADRILETSDTSAFAEFHRRASARITTHRLQHA